MCTARTKLKEVEQEMDCLYADIANLRMIFACIGFVISVGFLVY